MRLSVIPDGHSDIELIVAAAPDTDVEIGSHVKVTADLDKAVLLRD